MIAYVGAALLAAGFLLLIKVCKLIDVSRQIIITSRLVLGVVRDASLADAEKERALQGHAKTLFLLCAKSCAGIAAALLLPALLLWGLDRLGWAQLDASIAVLTSWQFLVVSSAAICLLALLARRSAGKRPRV